MNLLAAALITGILFLPGSALAPAHVEASTTASTTSAQGDDPSPSLGTVKPVPVKTYQVKLTAYNAVPSQTDGDPSTTASGLPSNSEVIAARSQDLWKELPFGTVVKITRTGVDTPACNFHKIESYVGYRVIADTMNARWTKRVDVELDMDDTVKVEGRTMSAAYALGVCTNVTVEVVGRIDLKHIPQTQAGLASLFVPPTLAVNK